MAAKILTECKQQVSELTLIPSDGGRFELVVDGDLLYSKLRTGCFPDEAELVDQLRTRT